MTLPELRDLVSGAREGSRELDGAIWMALEPAAAEKACSFHGNVYAGQRYTKVGKARFIAERAALYAPLVSCSTDAALALIERVAPNWFKLVGDLDPDDSRAVATIYIGRPDEMSFRGFAPPKQYALALISALLAALEAGDER